MIDSTNRKRNNLLFRLLIHVVTYAVFLIIPIDTASNFTGMSFAAGNFTSNSLDDYSQSLSKKYPYYASTIRKLIAIYPYWVITLEEQYGIPPILAMNCTSEAEFAILFRDPDLFMQIFSSIPKQVGNDEKRAQYAVLLANALSVSNPSEAYQKAFEAALAQDNRQDRNSVGNQSYVQFIRQYPQPKNYFEILKKDPVRLTTFLEMIQQMDYRTIAMFINYPNAGSFLMATGLKGYDLLTKHGEEILFLSIFLDEADQKRLPELFLRYPEMGMVVEEIGIEGFLTFLAYPEFFHGFIQNFSSDRRLGCLIAYEYIQKAAEHSGIEKLSRILKGNHCDYLAGTLAEISIRHNRDETPGYIAVINDPYITDFILEFRNRGMKLLFDYGNLRIAESIVKYWGPSHTQMETGIEAIEKYGPMGIQAVYHFNHSEEIKQFASEHGVKALMVFHYKDRSDYYRVFSDKEDALEDYELEPIIGYPVPKKTGIIEFAPGYDLVKNCYLSAKHGRMPTLGEICFSALDIVDIGMTVMTVGGWKATGGAALQSLKSGAKSVGKTGAKETTKVLSKSIKSTRKAADHVYKNTLKQIPQDTTSYRKLSKERRLIESQKEIFASVRKSTNGLNQTFSDDYWFIKMRSHNPEKSINNIISSSQKWSGAANIKIRKLPGSMNPALMVMKTTSSYGNRTALVLGEELVMSTLCYEGISAMEDRINKKLMKQIKETAQ